MISRKKLPYIFLGILILIIIFVGGVQYGKSVEQQNKKVNSYMMNLTPTQKISPIPEKMVQMIQYTNKVCGLQFLYPSNVEKAEESTNSASFTQQNKRIISVNCDAKDTKTIAEFKTATDSMKLKNQTIRSKMITKDGQQLYMLIIVNNLNGRTIYVTIDKDFYPVFESTYLLTI